AAIARRLDALLDEEAGRRFGRSALPAVTVQVEQLRARLHAFAQWQAEWAAAGWRIAAFEAHPPEPGVPFDVDGRPILLRGRIDRIDHNERTGEWAVFDYKTSDTGEKPEKTHRKGRGDAKRWIDLQLPLYRHLLPALRDGDGAQIVPPDAVDRVRLGYILLPRDLDGVGAAPLSAASPSSARSPAICSRRSGTATARSSSRRTPWTASGSAISSSRATWTAWARHSPSGRRRTWRRRTRRRVRWSASCART